MTATSVSEAARNHLLALADDEHIIGARHARWIGLGPFLEEDLAFCSIAQDELGHAISLYEVILGTDDDRLIDHFALLRAPEDYRSCWLAEAPCDSWNDALVRHWLYDHGEALRWTALADSSVATVADRAAQAQREEIFHREHADLLMARGLSTTEEARAKLVESVSSLVPIAYGMWDPLTDEAQALDEGVVAESSAELAERWWSTIMSRLAEWNVTLHTSDLEVAIAERSAVQQNRRRRSDDFAALAHSLQEVIALDPSAAW